MLLYDIILPTIAMALLVFVVTIVLFFARFGYMKSNPPTAADFADGASAQRYFAPVEMAANNHRNLFEMPVLFFALVPLLIIMGQDTKIQVGLAWAYVVLRAAHSYVHIGPKTVQHRFMLFLLSTIVLMAMWIGFAVDYATATMAMAAVADAI